MDFSNTGKIQRLDITLENDETTIARNFYDTSVFKTGEHKGFLALLDAILNPGKYEVHVHDLRSKEVYSPLSFTLAAEDLKVKNNIQSI